MSTRRRATLARARISLDGVRMPFFFNDEFGNAAYVRLIAEQWKAAFGLVVELQPMTWADYERTAVSSAGFPGAFRLSWQPNYPGPDQYIGPLFSSRATSEGNFGHFSDVAFDTTLTRETRRANEPEDLALEYQRLENRLCKTMPLIPVTFAGRSYLVDTDRLTSALPRVLELPTGFPALRELSLKDAP